MIFKLNIMYFTNMETFQESINFHDSFEELHEYVSPDSLPEEFGGNRGPFETR